MITSIHSHPVAQQPDRLREKAAQLETAFLTEMLGHAGLDAATEGFSGGIGEEQFASFLREEQAKALVQSGGIGLTERLYRAMGGAE
ncbi:rod-binding protein [Falsirhodobacter deserti]|uniref:rod-binding protein n=1 Tax=Falsirhodobacter deserti TaxID=1365611 RepID=UPI000FE3EA35|nr:rod-binding protein [Falsirhodobacter deserti]